MAIAPNEFVGASSHQLPPMTAFNQMQMNFHALRFLFNHGFAP
jgi:hypothetical protein